MVVHATEARTLTLLQWNLRGLASKDYLDFIEGLSELGQWDVVGLQEIGTYSKKLLAQSPHRLFETSKTPGNKPLGVLVHERLAPFIVGDALREERCLAVDLVIRKLSFRAISAHLSDDRNREAEPLGNLYKTYKNLYKTNKNLYKTYTNQYKTRKNLYKTYGG